MKSVKPFVYRSAITGKFVTSAYAKRYPHLTVKQTVVSHCEHKNQHGKRRCKNCDVKLPKTGGTVKYKDNAC